MADAAPSAPIAPLRAPIVGLHGGELSKQQKNGGGLAGAGKEYSKYLQVFCMTFAIKGRHQTEWPSRRKGVAEQIQRFLSKSSSVWHRGDDDYVNDCRDDYDDGDGNVGAWHFMASANNAICCWALASLGC